MKCLSCEIEINPQWKHAIDINVCPFCGNHIMEEHLKNLFSSLRETMESLLKYPDQLNDWMLSNHAYIKTDSPQLLNYLPMDLLKEMKKLEEDKDFHKRKESQKFTVKVQTENGTEEVVAEKLQSEEKTNEFLARAEVVKTDKFKNISEKNDHYKKIMQQIKRAGSTTASEGGGSGHIPAEMLEQADPEAIAEYQSMMSGGEIASSLPDTSGDEEIPAVALAMAAAASKGGMSSNARDLMKLQQLQDRTARAREHMASGSKGSFSRS